MISILMFWWMVCYYWCRSGGPLSPDRAWEIGSMLPEPPLEPGTLFCGFHSLGIHQPVQWRTLVNSGLGLPPEILYSESLVTHTKQEPAS